MVAQLPNLATKIKTKSERCTAMEEVPYFDGNHCSRIIWIDETTGSVRPEKVPLEQIEYQTFFGTAQEVRRLTGKVDWFALTNNDDGVLLFRNGKFIPLYEPPCNATIRDFGAVSRFRLFYAETTLIRLSYFNPYAHPLRLLDCTYDELDRVSDDLLYAVADALSDGRWGPADEGVPLWRDGI